MLLCFVVKKVIDTRTPPPPQTASIHQPTITH